MVVHCAQVRYSLKHHYAKDVNSVAQVTSNGVRADVFPLANGKKLSTDFRSWRLLPHFNNHVEHTARDLRLPGAAYNQSQPEKAFSKSLEHLPSISVTQQRKRVVRRQSSLNQLDTYLISNTKSEKISGPDSKPSRCWTPSTQQEYSIDQRADSDENLDRSSTESPRVDNGTDISSIPSFLPPLPTGSLIYQTALRDTYFERDGASSSCASEIDSESGSDSGSSTSSAGGRRRKTKLSWCGPIVEYKGHHIYLSTLNNINLNLGRYGIKRWQ